MKKNNIPLYNRYGYDVHLSYINDTTYKLCAEECNYFTPHYDEDVLVAIDPDGGPFISIGTRIDGTHIIKEIKWNESLNSFLIILE